MDYKFSTDVVNLSNSCVSNRQIDTSRDVFQKFELNSNPGSIANQVPCPSLQLRPD